MPNKKEALDRLISLTDAKQKAPGEYRCKCPVHGGKRNDTFVIKEDGEKLLLFCHASCTQDEVVAWAIDNDCWPSSNKQFNVNKAPYPTWKVDNRVFKLAETYKYKSGAVGRYELDGEKQIIPFFRAGGSKHGYPKDSNWQRPLYDPSNALIKDKIYIVEGEKCVDVAVKLGIPAITWPGGSKALKKAAWDQIKDKTVYIWPDNDEPGKTAAAELKQILKGNKNKIFIAKIPDALDEKEDIADLKDLTKKEALEIFESGEKLSAIVYESLDSFILKDIPPRLIHLGFIFEESINMIHAWRGVGKSMFGLNCAYACAAGTSFLRYEAQRPESILYIDGEMSQHDLQSRLRMICEMNDGELPANFNLTNPQINNGLLPRLATDEGRHAYDSIIDKAGVKIIFVDNISCLVGGDENDGEAWQPVADWANAHRMAGRSVVFIHHSGKSGAQRGISQREDLMDAVVALRRPAIDDVSEGMPQGAFFEVHIEKIRGFIDQTPYMAWLQKVTDPAAGNLIERHQWFHSSIQDYTRQRALQLKATSDLSQREIAKILGVNQSTVSRWIAGSSE